MVSFTKSEPEERTTVALVDCHKNKTNFIYVSLLILSLSPVTGPQCLAPPFVPHCSSRDQSFICDIL